MFKLLNDNAKLPKRKNEFAAGLDVFASEDISIKPGYTEHIQLGIALDLNPDDYKGLYLGLALRDTIAKKGLILPNGIGIINIDSTDEIRLLVFKPLQDPSGYENRTIHIKKGDKVGQLIIQGFYSS